MTPKFLLLQKLFESFNPLLLGVICQLLSLVVDFSHLPETIKDTQQPILPRERIDINIEVS